MRVKRDFSARPICEQIWLASETWCDHCRAADIGMLHPVEYEEGNKLLVEGHCPKCNHLVVTEIIERDGSQEM